MKNRLAAEKSPYLLQHAENPVDWYPWGDEAFEQAKELDKPVFLSIGYATCHWCHVMEHESFEDEEVARLMNEAFINIKVDREERPDIDNTYMTICQMLTGSGGWPLTVVLTPDKLPFYAATYLPKESSPGRIGMKQFVPAIQKAWADDRQNVMESAAKVSEGFQKTLILGKSQSGLPDGMTERAAEALKGRFDSANGGFGTAPKFPSPHQLLFLYAVSDTGGVEHYGEMSNRTLTAMALGGIREHAGGGFHRYSTDAEWLLPHFEKMLYDQATMLLAYSEGWNQTGNSLFREISEEIVHYLDECLTSPGGAFYSAEDADTEGEEGQFYVWTTDEIRSLLSDDDADFFINRYGLKEEGNFSDETTGMKNGTNIPHLSEPIGESEKEKTSRILEKLRTNRAKRVRPLLDDKILTDWNGLMIGALARAGTLFEDAAIISRAERAFDHICDVLMTESGGLLHRYRDGEAAVEGIADDYTSMIFAATELYLSTFEPRYLQKALGLQNYFDRHFFDDEAGGYYFTGENMEEVLGRQKELYDGALPSSNSMAAYNGFRLSRITGNPDFEAKARSVFDAFSEPITDAPAGYTFAMYALRLMNASTNEIVISTSLPPDDKKIREVIRICRQRSAPGSVILLKSPDIIHDIEEFAPFTASYQTDQPFAVWVCSGFSCKAPVYSKGELIHLFESD